MCVCVYTAVCKMGQSEIKFFSEPVKLKEPIWVPVEMSWSMGPTRLQFKAGGVWRLETSALQWPNALAQMRARPEGIHRQR